MIALLRQRNYGLLWFGGLISLGGDWLLITVLPFYVYSRTGSALAASAMFAAMGLPYLLFGSISGVFVDRWDRRRIMIAADRLLTGVFVVGGLAIFADGILTGLLVPFVQRLLHAGSTEFGWLLSARGLGGLGGSFLISLVAARIAPGRLLALSLALVAGLLLVALHVLIIPVELVVLFLAGFPAVGWMVSEQTLLQTLVEDRFRGRVFGAYSTSASLLNIVGLMFAGLLALPVGIAVMLHVSVGLTLGAGVLAWLLLRQPGPAAEQRPAHLEAEGESA